MDTAQNFGLRTNRLFTIPSRIQLSGSTRRPPCFVFKLRHRKYFGSLSVSKMHHPSPYHRHCQQQPYWNFKENCFPGNMYKPSVPSHKQLTTRRHLATCLLYPEYVGLQLSPLPASAAPAAAINRTQLLTQTSDRVTETWTRTSALGTDMNGDVSIGHRHDEGWTHWYAVKETTDSAKIVMSTIDIHVDRQMTNDEIKRGRKKILFSSLGQLDWEHFDYLNYWVL